MKTWDLVGLGGGNQESVQLIQCDRQSGLGLYRVVRFLFCFGFIREGTSYLDEV